MEKFPWKIKCDGEVIACFKNECDACNFKDQAETDYPDCEFELS